MNKYAPDLSSQFKDKVIIVTGSTQGSGAETAKLLAHRGAKGITICGRKEKEGLKVIWSCDPMHGNTFSTQNGHKTRHFDDVLKEITGFFEAHKKVGTNPGGVHLELTGDDVTECLGGGSELDADDLSKRYETMCDPRLNGSQSIDIAFRIAELLHKN